MRSTLFEQPLRPPAPARFALAGPRTLRAVLGPDLYLRAAAVLAHQGRLEFRPEPPAGVAPLIKRVVAGDGSILLRVSGTGEVYAADRAREVVLVTLEGDGLAVAADALLALDAGLDRRPLRFGAGTPAATQVHGNGDLALTAAGGPLMVDCAQPTHVDPAAAVAWSATLTPQVVAGIRVGRGAAPARYAFHGPGFVVVAAAGAHPAPVQA